MDPAGSPTADRADSKTRSSGRKETPIAATEQRKPVEEEVNGCRAATVNLALLFVFLHDLCVTNKITYMSVHSIAVNL